MPDLTCEYLKTILRYEPDSGKFYWIKPTGNRTKIHSLAGSFSVNGYVKININNKKYNASNLAFLYMTGRFPTNLIDHKNQVKSDNRWSNLRECDHSQNNMNNSKIGKRTKNFGYPRGVSPTKTGKFLAQCKKNKINYKLGTYSTIEEAQIAYINFVKKHFGEEFAPIFVPQ